MNTFEVRGQVSFLLESLITQMTLKGLLASVRANMTNEVRILLEGMVANFANEGTRTRMDA